MPIYRLLQNTAFNPETVSVMAAAFDDVCHELGLAERTDPLRDTVARKVIEIAQRGEHDPIRLRASVLGAIRK